MNNDFFDKWDKKIEEWEKKLNRQIDSALSKTEENEMSKIGDIKSPAELKKNEINDIEHMVFSTVRRAFANSTIDYTKGGVLTILEKDFENHFELKDYKVFIQQGKFIRSVLKSKGWHVERFQEVQSRFLWKKFNAFLIHIVPEKGD